ncbi:hypothetical protein AJ80_01888 [Polytolypa hystricis UAMH7299]|uniref:Methyltransferase n=1 Tax=Polytolypa hystricis (strain UAMH7299) TaxID=1447883 RepID=A0A2B7YZ24_POLH7|nr:hypothetical protein AJ80_01888 [Polytolypa hystricis UAMH7299]
MSNPITATIRYVQRDKKRPTTEKPYILHYAAPAGFPQNNFTIDSFPGIKVHNLRTAKLSYQEHGMTVASLDSSHMRPEDFDNDEWIERVYLPELHKCICKALGAEDMTVFDWMLRKRSVSFPKRKEGEENEEATQPSLSAHIDYTEAELDGRLDKYFGDEKGNVLKRRYQVINIWKPLSGPCRDYPMAYLDPKSVDRQNDLFAVDEVFPTVANEVFQVYYNPKHKWYYVPDQLDSEVAIFNAFDSEKGQDIAVPHCSFDLGEAGSGIPRQSIEVRAFVFY